MYAITESPVVVFNQPNICICNKYRKVVQNCPNTSRKKNLDPLIYIWYTRIKYVHGFFSFDRKMYMAFHSYLLIIVTRFYLLKKSPIVKPFTLKHGFCISAMLCPEVCECSRSLDVWPWMRGPLCKCCINNELWPLVIRLPVKGHYIR